MLPVKVRVSLGFLVLYFFGFGLAFGLFPAISREKQSHQLNVDKLMIEERKRKKKKKERK